MKQAQSATLKVDKVGGSLLNNVKFTQCSPPTFLLEKLILLKIVWLFKLKIAL